MNHVHRMQRTLTDVTSVTMRCVSVYLDCLAYVSSALNRWTRVNNIFDHLKQLGFQLI